MPQWPSSAIETAMRFKMTALIWRYYSCTMIACLVQWLVHLTAIQEVPGSIPGYNLEIFLEVQGLVRGPPSLVRTTGYLLDILTSYFLIRESNCLPTRSSEIQLRKLKLKLRDKHFANHKAPCTDTASVGLGSSGLQHHGFNLMHSKSGSEFS